MRRWQLVVLGSLTGCAVGAGPFQPGRAAFATAGARHKAGGGWNQREVHEEHVAAIARRVHGPNGDGPMYDFDSAYYIGLKQGASWTRESGGAWSPSHYMMEGHATAARMLLGDRLLVGASVFAAGYGSTNQAEALGSYSAFGAEPFVKLGAGGNGLRVAAGPMYGRVSHRTLVAGVYAKEVDDVAAVRGTVAIDRVLTRLRGNDVLLAAELQYVQVATFDTTDGPIGVEAVGFNLELVLSAF